MKKIVSRARDLVGSYLAWVTTLDEGAQLFRNLATEGNLSLGKERMTVTIDRGAVSVVMATKSFFVTQDYLSDPRFTHSEDLDGQFKAERIMSLAGFPILSEGKVQGLLFVADRYARHYTGREISVLGSFALHAGVAMRNAENFAQLTQALKEAEHSRRSLEDHISGVEASAHAHDEMMSLLAQGADLSRFMRRMAALVGGAIQIWTTPSPSGTRLCLLTMMACLSHDCGRGDWTRPASAQPSRFRAPMAAPRWCMKKARSVASR